MINLYNELINYSGEDKNAFEDYLTLTCLIDIFTPVFKEYQEKGIAKKVVKYIAFAYSVESPKVVIGSDWQKIKKSIFKHLDIPDTYVDDIVMLKNKAVLDTVIGWLDFQDNLLFKLIQIHRDLLVEMQESAVSNIKKSSGETDFEQKFKNVEHARELRIVIRDLESELIQNDTKLKEANKEARRVKAQTSFGAEHFAN